ncbi:uncharacterized protein LOC115882230 [Sitophilus oryzae]|uniref:Uncharacterized protein LOC115882230 n=1 Tax=Sitophilus oryzae TaxID=7048 RepID=A0A6J2XZ14_SITOR|nr:uncharacterized protein LOC115882230 [Sitophilus oryzae]
MALYFKVIFTSICLFEIAKCQITNSIPEELQGCYRRNFTITARPPLTVPLLVELIRKIEIDPKYTMNTRMLSSWMMRKVVYDGIRKSPGLNIDENIALPYAATLNKFHKFKVINDYLLDGTSRINSQDFLTLDELCFLHKLVSNSIDPFENGEDLSVTCQDNSFSNMQFASDGSDAQSACPLKLGNVKTNWGSISVSHLIAGVATGLQQNQVTFQRIIDAIHTNTGATNISSALLSDANDVNHEVDNVLFATIVGDLGEVVLSQATENPIIGNQGYWNDTLLPRAFYLRSRQWDLTQAEILAGIDAAIIGKTVQHLVNILDSTRLSQIIDMYYSSRGIPYQFDFKVSNRSNSLEFILTSKSLEDQIYGATILLREIRALYPLTLTPDYIRQLSTSISQVYTNASRSIANSFDQIEYVGGIQLKANLEVIVILDNTFAPYETQRMLYSLAELIDLSYYGSSIGIINGQNGNWIVNVTREYFQMFQSFEQMDQASTWPRTLSLSRSLESVINYYQNKTNIDCSARVIWPVAQAVVVFNNDGRITDNDGAPSRRLIQTIKDSYPQTHMLYMSEDRNSFFKDLLVEDDDSIINPSADALSTAKEISSKLSVLPAGLIKFYCNYADVRFEKYLTPGVENRFEIHREYIKRGAVTTKFLNKDYGDLAVCFFASRTSAPTNKSCQSLTVNGEISFNSRSLCTTESACDVQYTLTSNNSQVKCAESDCRYPDQVLVIITYSYTSGSSGLGSGFFLSVSLILVAWLTNLF